MEFWKDIPGLDGYQASTLGRIKSLAKSYKTENGALAINARWEK
jgi:hypothetical protein